MRFRMIYKTIICFLLLVPTVKVDIIYSEEQSESSSGGDTITNYNYYYNYYYINDTEFDYVDIYSMNNTDVNSYWRPKYEDLNIPISDYVEFNNKNIKVNKNGFDANWSTVNKKDLPTSRALEYLGYDFLLSRDIVNVNTGAVDRSELSSMPITAPVFIMNVYKALGIELYDIYFKFNENDSSGGLYVSRTNPETYWELFLNDHPIDYSVYNDTNVDNALTGKVLTTADAITILSQMLDRYGEPVISKHEEYLLLQVYGKDVPVTLEDSQKEAWSYLKCRGIIGEEELDYGRNLSFEDMMDLLLRASDTDSRTNFKEVQITTTLDDEFVKNGYYENTVTLVNQPSITPTSIEIDWASASRIDFLVEIDESTMFRNKNTGRTSDSLFISDGPMHNDYPIKGSIYEGIKDGYYHFSIPRSEISSTDRLYINTRDMSDLPLNYQLSDASGGVYSNGGSSTVDTAIFSRDGTFNEMFPNEMYVDADRIQSGSSSNVYALSRLPFTVSYPAELLDIEASISALSAVGSATEGLDGKHVIVKPDYDKLAGMDTTKVLNILAGKLVIKPEFQYSSNQTSVILGLTGDKLLVSLDKAKETNLILNYKVIPESNLLVIYSNDGSIITVDNKNKTIQKGNTYLRVKEDQSLFTSKDGEYLVDFRALYGTKETGFSISNDATGSTVVTMFNNKIISAGNTVTKVGNYTYHSIKQILPYVDSTRDFKDMAVDVLVAMDDDGNITEALLPMASGNALGNYIMYGSFDGASGQESYKLLVMGPSGSIVPADTNTSYNDMFIFKPKNIPTDKYVTNVYDIKSKNTYGFKNIPGVGWCYELDIVDSSGRLGYMAEYKAQTKLLPFAISSLNSVHRLLNFNLNYYSQESFTNLASPKAGASPIPAIVGIQTLFTDPKATASLSIDTVKSSNASTAPTLYFGTQKVRYTKEGKIVSEVDNISLESYLNEDVRVISMGKLNGTNGPDSYLNPRLYSITSLNYDITLNEDVSSNNSSSVTKNELDLQEFFKQFEGITFMNFIYALDNSMSILYYIVTRVVPLVILCMLIIMLILSMVSDIKIVQLFCERVFDPVKLLTFGNHTIHTLRSYTLLFSLTVALILMGMIQMGNLEKIIMFVVKMYYSVMSLFG